MSQFEIINLDGIFDRSLEPEGATEKTWIDTSQGKALFKLGVNPEEEKEYESRTDWSERVVSEINNLIGLPSAHYDLAELNSMPGTISYDLTQSKDSNRLSLEELLVDVIDDYSDRFYNPKTIICVLQDYEIRLPPNYSVPAGIKDGADLFVGILMVDALTSNSDRHDRNLDIVRRSDGVCYLSPCFDNGSTLGALEDNDLRSYISPELYNFYYSHSYFSVYSSAGKKSQTGLQAFEAAAKQRSEPALIWLKSLNKISLPQLEKILSKIPNSYIDPEARNFAKQLLKHNYQQLKEYEVKLQQQYNVERVAPVLENYLKLNRKNKVENKDSVVEYDKVTKILKYNSKSNFQQRLTAKRESNGWQDIDTCLSDRKVTYFLEQVAPKINKFVSQRNYTSQLASNSLHKSISIARRSLRR